MDITTFSKLYSIFSAKRWHDKDGHEIVFRNFCHLLGNINDKQQKLLLELADRYTWLTFSEYQGKLISILENIPQIEIENITRIILFPVMNPRDEEKTKSGHGVLMILRGIRPLLTRYKHIRFQEVEAFDFFEHQEFALDNDVKIFLLDDFLGTGDTIRSTVEMLLTKPGVTVDRIKVITIAAHIQATTYLNSVGIQFYTDLVTNKGISDYYISPELEDKTSLMKEIEKLIPSTKYSFGYGRSEALITLYRTPNNTFPIFWQDHKKNDETFTAPFPRF
jgi:hypothetical protein